jgi:ketol-acid reductoisomerase
MMKDWGDDDAKLLEWRRETGETPFEQTTAGSTEIPEQEYFDNAVLMVAFVKAGVELAFDTMVASGIKAESAYYESLHEVPLIANLIGRRKLQEMNRIISDTAEYGNYLFAHAAVPLLASEFMNRIDVNVMGKPYTATETDNLELIEVNQAIRNHPVEEVGFRLRSAMQGMKARG